MKRKRGPSDGEIYEAVSRKANPELFAAVDEAIAKSINRPGSETVPRVVKVNGDKPDLYAACARIILEIEAEDRAKLKNGDKDWATPCMNCEALPTVHPVQLCGPCCWGEAETAGGNW